ncbi:aquaporin Z [Sanguibacter gelidistatuariae]|uniref:Aquaporin Z n=1 Tax=Sanguibacter gelidistatuariae TaxID=1814289 RepID=A0A1G6KUC6_9MICO|nr:aquaporin [Sanguibacter gelidistatuariae]SDC34428.1 aquaporin Z [Sanguibacter gelidistatuariae]
MSQDASAQQTPITETVVIDHERDAHSSRPALFTSSPFALIGAELLGTFLLVFVGVGMALYASLQGIGSLEVALGFGVALIAGIAAVGHISGGHFNPAVTFGAALAGRTPWKLVPVYWITQIVGAVAAAAALFATIPKSLTTGDTAAYSSLKNFFSATANGFGDHSPAFASAQKAFFAPYLAQGATQAQINDAINSGQLVLPTFTKFDLTAVAIMEVIATALFVGVILAVTDKRVKAKSAPIVIGLTFFILLMLATPFDGGSLNPARSLAAALFSDGWALSQVWIFWVAPLVGAAIAALFYRGFAGEETVVDYVYYGDVAVEGGLELDEIAVEEDAAAASDVVVEEVVVEEIVVVEEVKAAEPDAESDNGESDKK